MKNDYLLLCIFTGLFVGFFTNQAQITKANTPSSIVTPNKNKLEEKSYIVFDDFRIPVRENIPRALLIKSGWHTPPNMYQYRCRNYKRVRLTYWYYNKEDDADEMSTFINITEGEEPCKTGDKVYSNLN